MRWARASLSATSPQLATSSAPAPLALDERPPVTGVGVPADPPGNWSRLPMPSVVEINGKDLINDTLQLDLSIVPPSLRTIIYNGGAGGYDTLIVHGGKFQTETYTPTGKNSGIITYSTLPPGEVQGAVSPLALDGRGAGGEGAASGLTIIFTGLEPVYDDNESYSLVVDATNAGDVSINDDNINGVDALNVASSSFESITFTNKSFLILDTGGDSVVAQYTRPSAGLYQIKMYGNSSNTYYTFDQPPPGGTLGSLYIQEDTTANDSDTLDFSSFTSDLTVDLTGAVTTTDSDGQLSLTLASNAGDTGIENVITGSGDDTITGNSRDNTLNGGDGNNTFYVGGGNDSASGGNGDDVFYTGPGNNSLYGGTGDNTFYVGQGNNDMVGGYGENWYEFSAAAGGSNSITSGNGTDMLDFSAFSGITFDLSSTATQPVGSGYVTLSSGSGISNIVAGGGNNTITGNNLGNVITAGDGNNTINAGNGYNQIQLGNGANQVNGGSGTDDITVGDGNNSINAGDGDDWITAGGGNNSINTGGGNNTVDTGSGTNSFSGTGDDVINGEPNRHAPDF